MKKECDGDIYHDGNCFHLVCVNEMMTKDISLRYDFFNTLRECVQFMKGNT
jgi:hypothetical protein